MAYHKILVVVLLYRSPLQHPGNITKLKNLAWRLLLTHSLRMVKAKLYLHETVPLLLTEAWQCAHSEA
jgi:hypothetical protein